MPSDLIPCTVCHGEGWHHDGYPSDESSGCPCCNPEERGDEDPNLGMVSRLRMDDWDREIAEMDARIGCEMREEGVGNE